MSYMDPWSIQLPLCMGDSSSSAASERHAGSPANLRVRQQAEGGVDTARCLMTIWVYSHATLFK